MPPAYILPAYLGLVLFTSLLFILMIFFRKYKKAAKPKPYKRWRLFGQNTTSYYSLDPSDEEEKSQEDKVVVLDNKSGEHEDEDNIDYYN